MAKPRKRRAIGGLGQLPKFRDGKTMTPLDVKTGGGWGYACRNEIAGGFVERMPQRFQAEAATAGRLLSSELKKMTKKKLQTFIEGRGGWVATNRKGAATDTKADLVVKAQNTQMARLYPSKACDKSDR